MASQCCVFSRSYDTTACAPSDTPTSLLPDVRWLDGATRRTLGLLAYLGGVNTLLRDKRFVTRRPAASRPLSPRVRSGCTRHAPLHRLTRAVLNHMSSPAMPPTPCLPACPCAAAFRRQSRWNSSIVVATSNFFRCVGRYIADTKLRSLRSSVHRAGASPRSYARNPFARSSNASIAQFGRSELPANRK
jgi:hypothetical protein